MVYTKPKKKFNGKVYERQFYFDTKTQAKKRARSIRKHSVRPENARVVHNKSAPQGDKWQVYTRPKRRK